MESERKHENTLVNSTSEATKYQLNSFSARAPTLPEAFPFH